MILWLANLGNAGSASVPPTYSGEVMMVLMPDQRLMTIEPQERQSVASPQKRTMVVDKDR